MKKTADNILLALTPLFTVSFVSHLAPYIYIPSLPDIAEYLSIDTSRAGGMMAAYYLALSLTLIIVGAVGDRGDKRKMLSAASLLIFMGALLGSLPSRLGLIECGWALQGVAAAAITIIGQSWVGQKSDNGNITAHYSYMSIILSFAPLIAPVIGGMVTENVSWKVNFYAVATLSLFAAIFIFAVPPPPSISPGRLSFRQVFRDYCQILFKSKFLPLIATSLSCFIFQGSLMAYSSFLFIDTLGVSPATYGLISVPVVVGSILGQFPVRYLEKKRGLTAAFLFSSSVALLALLSSLAFYLITGSHTVAELAVVILVFSIGFGGQTLLALRNVMSLFQSKRSQSSALLNFLNQFMGYLAALAVQLLFAWVVSVMQVHNIICGAVSILIIFTSLIYLRKINKNELSL